MRLAPVLRGVAHALCAVPFAWLVADTVRDALGPDPVAQITHRTGIWALRRLFLWRSARASGIAVQVTAPAPDPEADRGPEPGPPPGGPAPPPPTP